MLASIHAGRLVILRASTCQQLQEASISTAPIRAAFQDPVSVLPGLAWAPAGDRVAIWGSCRRQPNQLHLYCTRTWRPAGTLQAPAGVCMYHPVWGLRGVAAFTAEHGVVLFPGASTGFAAPVALHAQPLKHHITSLPRSALAFSPDGAWLAVLTGSISARQVAVEVWAVVYQCKVATWEAPITPAGLQAILRVKLQWALRAPRLHVALWLAGQYTNDMAAAVRHQHLLSFT